MSEITEIEFQRMIEAGHETEQLEFRSSFALTKGEFMTERFIRTALGMANTKDGGKIIIGVGEKSAGKYSWDGINADDLVSFTYDKVKEQIDSFSSPTFKLDLGKANYNGKTFLVVGISEFTSSPIICKKNSTSKNKNGEDTRLLCEGDVYIRSIAGNIATKKVTEPY